VFSDDIWKVEDSSAKRLDPVLKQGMWGLGYAALEVKGNSECVCGRPYPKPGWPNTRPLVLADFLPGGNTHAVQHQRLHKEPQSGVL
jgi:hypothetical protein